MKIKNEAELLNKFCDKTHIKEILTEPFFNTNYNEVWSSDGVVLIRINPKALTNEYPKKKLAFPKLESACNKKITLEAVNQALDECPKIDEEIVIQDAVECEDCNGSGYVTWEYMDIHGHTHERESDCPVCDGTGEIEPERTKKTGKQITDENAVINIGNAYFRARVISKLKFALDFLVITSVKLIHNPDITANEFVLNDDIHIILMPMLNPLNEYDAAVKLVD